MKENLLELFSTEKENNNTFTFKEGEIEIKVNVNDNSLWLTQNQIAILYEVNQRTISEHLINIFKEKELVKSEVCKHLPIKSNDNNEKVRLNEKEPMYRKFRYISGICPKGTFSKPSDYKTALHYNLEGILAVGFRVTSNRGNKFRIKKRDKAYKEFKKSQEQLNK